MGFSEQLKEISYQMMLNETHKIMIENEMLKNIKNQGVYNSDYQDYYGKLLAADQKGYDMSLAFNEILLQNGETYNDFENGPDAVSISATNLLYKYGLSYPKSWYLIKQTSEGLFYGYHDSKRIDSDHLTYLKQVGDLLETGKINQNIYERLVATGEYFSAHYKLLSKYYNHEDLEKSQSL